jgi:hypothetical protein
LETRKKTQFASLDQCITEKSHKNILFMTKQSRLEVKKTLFRLSDGKNKMAANGFNHLKAGQIL